MSKTDKKVEKVLERKLPADVAKKYKLVTIRPGKYNFQKFGEVDLRTISLEKADAIVARGFQYLQLSDEGKKAMAKAKEDKKVKDAEKVVEAKGDLKEIDLSDIEKFDYAKGTSIVKALKIKTSNKEKATYFEALKKAQAELSK